DALEEASAGREVDGTCVARRYHEVAEECLPWVWQSVIGGTPVCASVGALEDGAISNRIDCIRITGVNHQEADGTLRQPGADPACAALRALERSAPRPRIDSAGIAGGNGQGSNLAPGSIAPPSVDSLRSYVVCFVYKPGQDRGC